VPAGVQKIGKHGLHVLRIVAQAAIQPRRCLGQRGGTAKSAGCAQAVQTLAHCGEGSVRTRILQLRVQCGQFLRQQRA
jgi:hypothetical protein